MIPTPTDKWVLKKRYIYMTYDEGAVTSSLTAACFSYKYVDVQGFIPVKDAVVLFPMHVVSEAE